MHCQSSLLIFFYHNNLLINTLIYRQSSVGQSETKFQNFSTHEKQNKTKNQKAHNHLAIFGPVSNFILKPVIWFAAQSKSLILIWDKKTLSWNGCRVKWLKNKVIK